MASQLAAQDYMSRIQAAAAGAAAGGGGQDYLARLKAAAGGGEKAGSGGEEYLGKLQAAARDPAVYAALAAQGLLPSYDALTANTRRRDTPPPRAATPSIGGGGKRSTDGGNYPGPLLNLPTGLTIGIPCY